MQADAASYPASAMQSWCQRLALFALVAIFFDPIILPEDVTGATVLVSPVHTLRPDFFGSNSLSVLTDIKDDITPAIYNVRCRRGLKASALAQTQERKLAMAYLEINLGAAAALIFSAGTALAGGSGDHAHDEPTPTEMLKSMEEMHAQHEHAHDFAAMEGVSEEDMHRTMDFLIDIGLVLPPMDSARGFEVFMNKGCVVCHAVNGVGGEIGPAFDAASMPQPMNAFEFAARMWRGAPAMALMQEDLLGEMITLDGQELADIVAFVHDERAQSNVTLADIPPEIREMIP